MTAPAIPADIAAWCTANDARNESELFEFLRIPSVSARSEHKADCQQAAQFVANALSKIGFATEIIPTPGHPIVLGEWRKAGQTHRRCSFTGTTTCNRPNRWSSGRHRPSSQPFATENLRARFGR